VVDEELHSYRLSWGPAIERRNRPYEIVADDCRREGDWFVFSRGGSEVCRYVTGDEIECVFPSPRS